MSRKISRRTVLRGMGAAVALPWLEAMSPAVARAGSASGKPPLRMVFMYHPLGAESTAWKGVTGQGKAMRLTPTLKALEPVKEDLLILDGLNGRPHPSSGHNRSACLWLSSAAPGKTDTWGVETDVTLDQVLAPRLSDGARQKSLELSCGTGGNLMHAMFHSWRSPGVPLGTETDPRDVFARMFGDARRDFYRQSVLDVVSDDARALKARLGQGDQRRLDEYLESVRTLERDIAAFEKSAGRSPAPKMARPEQPPPTLADHVKLMTDLLIVALQTDFTRVITFAPGDESESGPGTTYWRRLVDFGIDRAALAGKVETKYLDYGHHKASHDPKPTLPMIQAMDRWYVDRFLYLLQKLRSIPEGDGRLLDHLIVVYGCTNSSGTGNGWPGHSLKDVGCIVAGKGNGLLPKPGRQIRYAAGTPLCNLWLTLAQMLGSDRKTFGRSTGTLASLG
jgi:Protein of unknown function (DUF1552)